MGPIDFVHCQHIARYSTSASSFQNIATDAVAHFSIECAHVLSHWYRSSFSTECAHGHFKYWCMESLSSCKRGLLGVSVAAQLQADDQEQERHTPERIAQHKSIDGLHTSVKTPNNMCLLLLYNTVTPFSLFYGQSECLV